MLAFKHMKSDGSYRHHVDDMFFEGAEFDEMFVEHIEVDEMFVERIEYVQEVSLKNRSV